METPTVWAIIKVSHNPGTNQAAGGICGTAFFVSKNQFISAHHCFNSPVFIPNHGFSKVKVFLTNESGRIIENIAIDKLVPEYDLTIGRLNSHENVDVLPVENDFKVGDAVYNIGFPVGESLVGYNLRTSGDELIVENVRVKAFQQSGIIDSVPIVTVNADDVKIIDKQMIKLSYTSHTGFSGGPLILGGKVIGMMSLVIPSEYDPAQPAMAIRMADIAKYIAF
ncbi:MAG: hypothetical protein A2252_09625 [Elusimicrobia bacterium RIFOXYA2_FULL_39_19]|nr:MAG: hypothetical protein A2252_09625 [Elusimicrobia bacterium RIFOXYA2_FULL_39_19]